MLSEVLRSVDFRSKDSDQIFANKIWKTERRELMGYIDSQCHNIYNKGTALSLRNSPPFHTDFYMHDALIEAQSFYIQKCKMNKIYILSKFSEKVPFSSKVCSIN